MTQAKKQDNESQKDRITFHLKKEAIKSLKYVAFMSEKTQTLILDEALTDYFTKWEKKNGEIPKR